LLLHRTFTPAFEGELEEEDELLLEELVAVLISTIARALSFSFSNFRVW